MAKNRIIIEKDSKTKQILASVACDTLDTKSRLEVRLKNGKVYCKSNSFTELVPIFVIFKVNIHNNNDNDNNKNDYINNDNNDNNIN
jgi:hypothetical protein